MKKTVNFLLATIVLVPVAAWFFGTRPDNSQIQLIQSCAWVTLGSIIYCFVVGEITGNNSQVDKLWSILPIVYAWIVAKQSIYEPYVSLMAILVSLWGARLTYNFSRRGAYRLKFWEGEEDYRWSVLRQKPMFQKKWRWTLFNLGFICVYQNLLILLFTLPIVVAAGRSSSQPDLLPLLFSFSFLVFLWVEYTADQEQYDFQTEKHRRQNSGEPLESYAHGFVRTGMWAIVRHPNYAAEQGIWISFYLIGAAVSGEYFNWSIAGCVLLLLLFRGSADFSESISATKYPEYSDYISKVGRFLPRL